MRRRKEDYLNFNILPQGGELVYYLISIIIWLIANKKSLLEANKTNFSIQVDNAHPQEFLLTYLFYSNR